MDEICVQVKNEYSTTGMPWSEDVGENEEDEEDDIPYFEEDIVQYIVYNYILKNAANYSNKKIEMYLWKL